ncbi:hypothetical protein Pth03_45180 [Planotetraspora thailandica]|uniref:Uncharacterized protein n=1 Tax=Planotetraspora thailandica TaxID=487172 RepID=A0A8J3V8S9_9ACTN|nr:hypothetical protein [Planotetraspora thailandica]GII56129.1 hypothetical protein Pth03_45180 [Planotetraspora thailandica]
MTFLTLRQAAIRSDITFAALQKIVSAGLISAATSNGDKPSIPADVAERIRARTTVPLHRALPTTIDGTSVAVLRVSVATPVPDNDRRFIGFHADLTPGELLEALRGWWVGKPEKIARAGILPVTLGGFVVAVLTGLNSWETKLTDDGLVRHRFDARLAGYISDLDMATNMVMIGSDADLRIADQFLGKRLKSTSGGPIAYVPIAD